MTGIDGETILVVDDDPIVRELAVMMLEDLNFNIIEATNGEEALAVLENGADTVDLLFTDARMPGMSGIDLARVTNERWPKVKVLYCSGAHETVFNDGVPEDLRHPVLGKPYMREELAAKVRSVLDG
jgi:CheY-like chemotaxis protein